MIRELKRLVANVEKMPSQQSHCSRSVPTFGTSISGSMPIDESPGFHLAATLGSRSGSSAG